MRGSISKLGAALAGLLLLGGCTLQGTVTFHSGDADVDVVVQHRDPRAQRPIGDAAISAVDVCGDWRIAGLAKEPRPAPGGEVACRLVGRVTLPARGVTDNELTGMVNRSNGSIFLTLPRSWFEAGSYTEALTAIDLTLRFPGPVVATSSGAQVLGASVRVTDPRSVTDGGLWVTARDNAFDPIFLALAGALILGGAVGAVAMGLRLRRPLVGDPDAGVIAHVPDPDAAPPAERPHPHRRPAATEDPMVWSHGDDE